MLIQGQLKDHKHENFTIQIVPNFAKNAAKFSERCAPFSHWTSVLQPSSWMLLWDLRSLLVALFKKTSLLVHFRRFLGELAGECFARKPWREVLLHKFYAIFYVNSIFLTHTASLPRWAWGCRSACLGTYIVNRDSNNGDIETEKRDAERRHAKGHASFWTY